MYGNEEAAPPFREFLALLGKVVALRGFTKYRAQLDTQSEPGAGRRRGWEGEKRGE